MRRAARILLAAVATLAVAPAAASAHATLGGTSPERGAVVAHEPSMVVFRFDEPVEGTFGAVRVFDAHGTRVDQGDAFHPGGRGPQLGVHLRPHLPDGSYTATYRVISADGHVVSGGFVFSIGKAGASRGETVGQLLGRAKTGRVTSVAFGVARTLDPARVGANALHLYLINPRDGSQFTAAKEVDVDESMPSEHIGPLRQVANRAGPGHFLVPSAPLTVPGHWRIQVTVRVSDFDEYTTTVPVHVH